MGYGHLIYGENNGKANLNAHFKRDGDDVNIYLK